MSSSFRQRKNYFALSENQFPITKLIFNSVWKPEVQYHVFRMKTTGFFFVFFLQFCDHCMTNWTFGLLRYSYICLFLTIDYIYIYILFLMCSNISCILDTVRFSAIKQSLMKPFIMKLYYIYYFSKRRYCIHVFVLVFT